MLIQGRFPRGDKAGTKIVPNEAHDGSGFLADVSNVSSTFEVRGDDDTQEGVVRHPLDLRMVLF